MCLPKLSLKKILKFIQGKSAINQLVGWETYCSKSRRSNRSQQHNKRSLCSVYSVLPFLLLTYFSFHYITTILSDTVYRSCQAYLSQEAVKGELYLHDVQSLLITADKDAGRGRQGQRGGQSDRLLGEAAGTSCTVGITGILHLRHVVVVHLEHELSILILRDHFKGVWIKRRQLCHKVYKNPAILKSVSTGWLYGDLIRHS